MSAYDSVIINDASIGRELYIVGPDDEGDQDEVIAFPTVKGLKRFLASMNALVENDLMVVHGVLTSARSIPDDVDHSAYIIYLDSGDGTGIGSIRSVQEATPHGVEKAVEEIVELEMLESVDDVYILYGYEIPLCYTIDDEDVDEQILEECKHVAEKAKEISKAMEAEHE